MSQIAIANRLSGLLFILGSLPTIGAAQVTGAVDCSDCDERAGISATSVTDRPQLLDSLENAGKLFLVNRDKNLIGLKFWATDNSVVDFGIGDVDGNPYWDWYSTGVLYISPGDEQGSNHVWRVDINTGEKEQLTDSSCVPGGALSADMSGWYCNQMSPIAASTSGGLAYIQMMHLNDDGRPGEDLAPMLVISDGGQSAFSMNLRAVPKNMAWSVDGEWLLLSVPVDFLSGKDLVAVSKLTGEVCGWASVDPRPIDYIDWSSRNGGEVVYSAAGDLWLVPLKTFRKPGRCPKIDLRNKIQLTSTGDREEWPQWLHFNDLIAFVSDSNKGIWLLNAESLGVWSITEVSFAIKHSDWQSISDSNVARIKGSMRK